MFSSAYQDAGMLGFNQVYIFIEQPKCQMMKVVMIAMKKTKEEGMMKRKNRMLLCRKAYGAFFSLLSTDPAEFFFSSRMNARHRRKKKLFCRQATVCRKVSVHQRKRMPILRRSSRNLSRTPLPNPAGLIKRLRLPYGILLCFLPISGRNVKKTTTSPALHD